MPRKTKKPRSIEWNGYRIDFETDRLDEAKLLGDCCWQSGVIRLHADRTGQDLLDDALHEGLHALFPDMSEAAVGLGGRALAELVTKLGYRKAK